MTTESIADLIIATQKDLGRVMVKELERQFFDFYPELPRRTGDVHLPILQPDKAMTVKQLIEKLSALDGDLKVYIRHDEGEMSDGGTWMDDVTDKDTYEVLDMESHVVIDVT